MHVLRSSSQSLYTAKPFNSSKYCVMIQFPVIPSCLLSKAEVTHIYYSRIMLTIAIYTYILLFEDVFLTKNSAQIAFKFSRLIYYSKFQEGMSCGESGIRVAFLLLGLLTAVLFTDI